MPRVADAAAVCVKAHWRFKSALSVGLSVFFMVPYFALQHIVLLPVRTLRTTPIDDAIEFDPRWVWMYQSVYLLVSLVPWLATDRTHLERYLRGFVLISSVGFACFLFFPIAGPRPEVVPTTGMFGWLTWYDRPTNEWPSLHIGLASFTLLFGARISEGSLAASLRRRLLLAGASWTGAIAYAALATKQHFAVDLPAGLVLAWLAHRWIWRDARVAAAPRSGVGMRTLGEPGR
jgi:hypothetical protein